MAKYHLKSAALATAMLGFASTSTAQENCGGATSAGQWIGSDEAGSDIATSDSFLEQMALVFNGNENVSLFRLSAPAEVRLEAEGRGAGDPVIQLLDESGVLILEDDDSGGNGAARGEIELETGAYCLVMRSYDNADMTAFVRIGLTSHEPLTTGANSEPAQNERDTPDEIAASCANGVPVSGNAEIAAGYSDTRSVDDNGFYTFTLESPQAISVTATNEDADPVLVFYDGTHTELYENDDSDGLNARLDLADPLPAGDYCIAVRALDDTALPIALTISEYDPAAALAVIYNRGEAAPPLDGTFPVTDLGTLDSALRQDVQIQTNVNWFSIDVPEPGLMVIEAIAAGDDADPWVVIYDDLGREIAQNDDDGAGLDSFAAVRVDEGTYIVGVNNVGSSGANFARLLLQRFVAAGP